MSTPLLNAQLFQPPGAAAGIGGSLVAGQGSIGAPGAVAGFEAMVAALFGQVVLTDGGPLAAPPFQALVQASTPAAGAVDPTATTSDGQGAAGDKDASGDGKGKTADGQAATPDAALALLAGAALPATPQVVAPTATGPVSDAGTATEGGAKTTTPPTPQILDPAAAACAAEAKALPLAADPTAQPALAGGETKPLFAPAAAPETPTPAKIDATPAAAPLTDSPATPQANAAKADAAPPTPADTATPQGAANPAQTPAQTAAQTAALAQPAPAQAPARGEPLPSNHRAGRDKPAGKVEVAAAGGPKAAAHLAPHAKAQAALSEAPIVEAASAAAAAQDEDPGADTSDDRSSASAGSDQTQQTPTAQTPAALQAQQAAVRGSPQTVANFAAQMIKKLEAKTTRFDVQLDPAGLGKVDVRVEIGAEGRITAALSCHNPQAAKELQARSGELQKALEQAGFDITGGLSFEMAGGGNGQPGAGQNPFAGQNDSGPAFHGRAFATALGTADDAAQAAAEGALRFRHSRPAGVDIRI